MKYELSGQRFGCFLVKQRSATYEGWECVCDCGNLVLLRTSRVISTRKQICDCQRRERTRRSRITHGKSATRTYKIWTGMRKRCYNPRSTRYKYYGGRGIKLCDPWKLSYVSFLNDMGECPKDYTIERVDVNGNYELSNCIWAPWEVQYQNRRKWGTA
jgi:hypothetical protein